VLFAQYETYAIKDEATKRHKGVSSGLRFIRTQRTAAWDAKNRDGLPESLPLDWEAFTDAIAQLGDASKHRATIEALLTRAPEALAAKVRAAVERVGNNAGELARIANKLTADVNANAQESGT
jgi:hypothetical protein